jgi:hypothetical protein
VKVERRAGSIATNASFASLTRPNNTNRMGTRHRVVPGGAGHAKDVLLVSVELSPPRRARVPKKGAAEFATTEGAEGGMFFKASTTDDAFVSAGNHLVCCHQYCKSPSKSASIHVIKCSDSKTQTQNPSSPEIVRRAWIRLSLTMNADTIEAIIGIENEYDGVVPAALASKQR